MNRNKIIITTFMALSVFSSFNTYADETKTGYQSEILYDISDNVTSAIEKSTSANTVFTSDNVIEAVEKNTNSVKTNNTTLQTNVISAPAQESTNKSTVVNVVNNVITTVKKQTKSNVISALSGPGDFMSGAAKSNATSQTRQMIINYAKQFLGNPYVWGGTSLTEGVDCSGFTMLIYEKFGIQTGKTSRDQYAKCEKIERSELKPGDLVFYAYETGYIHHVAMYIGNNKIIHAASSKLGIIEGNIDFKEPYAYGRFLND